LTTPFFEKGGISAAFIFHYKGEKTEHDGAIPFYHVKYKR